MSILASKLAAAKAKHNQQTQAPQEPPTLNEQGTVIKERRQPLPPAKAIPATQGWQSKRSRGRPRMLFPKYALVIPPIREWMEHCLIHDPDAYEYCGSAGSYSQKVGHRKVALQVEYPRPTLRESFLQFCKDHGHQATVPQTFAALIVKAGLEAGWDCALTRAGDSRRVVIKGVCLRGQATWRGEDRGMNGPDRQRWIAKSKEQHQ